MAGRPFRKRDRTTKFFTLKEGLGKSVVERLSADLRNEFPQISGFSSKNIWRMQSLYLAWTEETRKLTQAVAVLYGENLLLLVAEIPWGHNILLLEKLKSPSKKLWYAVKDFQASGRCSRV
jgi:hypothetical protein